MNTTEQLTELLISRDLRFYGINQRAWDRREKLAFEAEAMQEPVEKNETLRRVYTMAVEYMNDSQRNEMLWKLKQLPPLPHDYAERVERGGYVNDPDTGERVWTTNATLLRAFGKFPARKDEVRS